VHGQKGASERQSPPNALNLTPIRQTNIRGLALRWDEHMKSSDTKLVRLIAVFKLFKTVLLIVVGVSVLRLIHLDISDVLAHFVRRLGLDPGSRYVAEALQKAAKLTPDRVKDIGIGSFIYSGLFLAEGIGLWFMKRWAAWFTVILTSSLVPVEIYEIYRHPTAMKFLVLALNIAIVGYLVYRIRDERSGLS
jgi:uncharacterized membrane protein (DUF2068 family)